MIDDVTVVTLGPEAPATGASVEASALAADEHGAWVQRVRTPLVAFLRPGDRFRPGKLERQVRVLRRSDPVVLTYTSYLLAGPAGGPLELVRAGGVKRSAPGDVLLSPPIEASTVVVRRESLSADVPWPVLARPGGDTACWAALARAGQLAGIDEALSDVRLDRARHGMDREHERERLMTLLACGAFEGAVASRLRRCLVRTLYVEVGPGWRPAWPGRGDRPAWPERHKWPPTKEKAMEDERDAINRDLQWALERQAERFATELQSWGSPDAPGADAVQAWPDAEIARLEEKVADLRARLAQKDETIDVLRQRAAHLERHVASLEAELGLRLRRPFFRATGERGARRA